MAKRIKEATIELRKEMNKIISNDQDSFRQDGPVGSGGFIWQGYEELCEQESTGKKTYEIYMRPPIIAKTFGLTDAEWRKISARFDDANEWHPERVALHERIVSTLLEGADVLSRRLREYEAGNEREPTIYCLRGACGSGKTTALRDGTIGGVLDENGEPNGTLAPDVIKMFLRRGGLLNHLQVHDEASMLGRKLAKVLHERAMLEPYSVVYDKSMAYVTDFEDVFSDAVETKRKVVIVDIDVPLELSAVRVLVRPKGGKSANIDFDGVVRAFGAIRKNRLKLHKQILENSGVIDSYTLKCFDHETKHLEDVMRYENDELRTLSGKEELAELAVMSDKKHIDAEIEKVRETMITDGFVSHFRDVYLDGRPEWDDGGVIAELERHIGKTIAEALDDKSR
ncbi:hypothetical protein IKF04_03565 [Candidatus Saccharibacteria bacterium]|nr:hypothetical protein [Candidatus Saccharibacteria bacterium]